MNINLNQPTAPKLSVAAKAGEMQIFSESFSYASQSTSQAVRKQPNSYSSSITANRLIEKNPARLIKPPLSKDSAMMYTI